MGVLPTARVDWGRPALAPSWPGLVPLLLIGMVMAKAGHDRPIQSFASDLGQITPISPKTPRFTQDAPEKILAKSF